MEATTSRDDARKKNRMTDRDGNLDVDDDDDSALDDDDDMRPRRRQAAGAFFPISTEGSDVKADALPS